MRSPIRSLQQYFFYGTESVDFNKVKSKIIGHFSDNDEWEPMEGIRTMETGMKAAGVDIMLYVYPKVGHGFVENDRPEYDPIAGRLAWERTIEFLRRIFKKSDPVVIYTGSLMGLNK